MTSRTLGATSVSCSSKGRTSAASSSASSAYVPSNAEVPIASRRVAMRVTSWGFGMRLAAASRRPSSAFAVRLAEHHPDRPGKVDTIGQIGWEKGLRLVGFAEARVVSRDGDDRSDR